MPRRAILDSNVVLRYLLGDDPKQSREAKDLIEKAPGDTLYLSAIILAEVTWTLRSHFIVPRDLISTAIQRVLAQPSISADATTREAVVRYANTNVDFIDCALAAASAETGLWIATYDKDYRKFSDVKAKLPRELLATLANQGDA